MQILSAQARFAYNFSEAIVRHLRCDLTTAEAIGRLQADLPGAIESAKFDVLDPYVVVPAEKLPEVATWLRDTLRFDLLNDITGVDYLEPDPKKAAKAGFDPHLEVLYHLSCFSQPGLRFTLKVCLPRWKNGVVGELPELPSLAAIWPAANWHEREVYDLLGIRFVGHPDPRRILLADDWVGHPLRKDYEFPLEYHDIRCR